MALPPLPAIGRVRIQIFGPVSGSAKWDEALWDRSVWAVYQWQDITPQSMVTKVTWGADDPAGVLTVSAAGSWTVTTYDPERLLDPSNGASVHATAIRPGKPMRLVYVNEAGETRIVRQGLIDEVEFDLITHTGTLRGTDQVQLMVGAKLPAGQELDPAMPATLRARAQYLIDKAKLTALVPVDNGAIQLVQNPDFETGDFSHWISSGGTAYLDNVIEQPAGGKWVAVVASTGGDYPQIQSDSMPVVAGKSYRFGCWGRNAGSNTTDRVARLELIGTGTVLWLIFDAASHPSDTWAWHETTWVAPSDGLVYILAYFGGVATPAGQWGCWDGFVFEEIPPDPPVGPVATNEASVWTHILTAAYDALYAAWMDRYGTLRFRSFGNPSDSGFQAGGADGIPISNMKTQGSLQGVYTRIVAYDDDAPTVPVTAFDATKASIYGDILLHRQQPVPNGQAWVDSVLADRSGSALQYVPGTLYPQTEDDLEDILELGMVDIAHLVVESVDPSIDVAARVLGGTINADTGTGWTAQIAAYIPAKEWEEAEAPIPPIEPPPPDTVSGVVRTYACIADARLAHSGSLDAGNGQDVQLPIGYIGGYRNRAVLAFAAIPLGDVVSIDKAELVVKIGGNNCGAFGSEPKVQVSRITGGWSEGSYNVSCGFATSNSVKYPGPGITSSGAVTTTVPKSTGSEKAIDITAIARAWHSGSGQYGVMVKSAGEDTSKYTTCFYSRHHGTSGNRPFLRLTLTVNA